MSAGLGHGCYFQDGDYVGLIRRSGITIVDFGVTLAGMIALAGLGPFAVLVFVYVYLVVLNATPLRTLGFRLFDAKLVDLNGDSANVLQLSFRMLIASFTLGFPLFDLCWINMDRSRQTLRDMLAGTYVVRTRAAPQGQGEILQLVLFAMGHTFVYSRVRKDTP
jgi:uncharacterized RDD family membrane protein YckC